MNAAEALNRTLRLVEAVMQQPPASPVPEHARQTERLLAEIARLMEKTRGLSALVQQQQEEIAALNIYANTLEDQLEDFLAREASQRWTP